MHHLPCISHAPQVSPQTTRRYQQQLRNLLRLTPVHLGLPAAFCARALPAAAPPAADVATGFSSASQPQPQQPQPQQPLPYSEAVSRLQQLPQCATPEKGLTCLVDVCHHVATAAEDIGAPPPSADELVPLITYVCVASQVASLPVELSLLQDLATDAQLSGEQGYSLATFQVALRWLLQLKWDQLQFHSTQPVGGGSSNGAASGGSNGGGNAAGGLYPSKRGQAASRRSSSSSSRARGSSGAGSKAIADSMELLRALEAELPPPAADALVPFEPPEAASHAAGDGSGAKGVGDGGGDPGAATDGAATNGAAADGATTDGGASARSVGSRYETLKEYGVRDLLAAARRLTIDPSSCVEKQDLIDLLLAHSHARKPKADPAAPPPRPAAGGSSGSGIGSGGIGSGTAPHMPSPSRHSPSRHSPSRHSPLRPPPPPLKAQTPPTQHTPTRRSASPRAPSSASPARWRKPPSPASAAASPAGAYTAGACAYTASALASAYTAPPDSPLHTDESASATARAPTTTMPLGANGAGAQNLPSSRASAAAAAAVGAGGVAGSAGEAPPRKRLPRMGAATARSAAARRNIV